MPTEAEALASILAWSSESPGWQRDALRRLATQAALEAVEIDELVAICKGDSPAVPLEAELLRGAHREQREVGRGGWRMSGGAIYSLWLTSEKTGMQQWMTR
ncbi:hypothetical protein I5G20_07875 [Pseudomonas aeruginosa]|nr:hypothetical protein [Pseudomonas aeruginosa]MBG7024347.1 hypothetical protein [Pseudomonas aeruginosa]MBG7371441.1 hypothetical protein [Pseudomonas aeruginosa]